MDFKLNTSARETTINNLVEEQVNAIQSNLARGERTTEMYIDKEFASEVRRKLEEILKGKPFTFQTVRRSPNQYTGQMQSFTSELIGNERYYKLYYHGE
jgi:hypothetical protein